MVSWRCTFSHSACSMRGAISEYTCCTGVACVTPPFAGPGHAQLRTQARSLAWKLVHTHTHTFHRKASSDGGLNCAIHWDQTTALCF